MKSKPKILFVCLGNICRSPMAEGIYRQLAAERGIDVITDSCGTGGWHVGEAPDPRAQQCMRRHGLDISDLRARQFRQDDLDTFDKVYVMDRDNYSDVISMATNEEQRQKVKLMLDESDPNGQRSVPDPYYGGDDGFERVFEMLSHAARASLTKLK